jgi:hypothetical protein
VNPEEAVRFEGFISHPGCATSKKETRIANFDTRFFKVGAIGTLIGILMSIPLFMDPGVWGGAYYTFNVYNWQGMALAYAGVAIGMLIHAIGLYSFHQNFVQEQSAVAAGFAVVASIWNAALSILLLIYGPDPAYRDPELGFLMLDAIPGFLLGRGAAAALFGITAILLGINIWLHEKEFRTIGIPPLLLAAVFIGMGGALFIFPIAIMAYFLLVFFVFVSIAMPRHWSDTSKPAV